MPRGFFIFFFFTKYLTLYLWSIWPVRLFWDTNILKIKSTFNICKWEKKGKREMHLEKYARADAIGYAHVLRAKRSGRAGRKKELFWRAVRLSQREIYHSGHNWSFTWLGQQPPFSVTATAPQARRALEARARLQPRNRADLPNQLLILLNSAPATTPTSGWESRHG